MKRLLLTITLIAVFASAGSAQDFGFKKKDIFLEASIQTSVVRDKSTLDRTASFNFVPKVGTFLSDHFVVGLAAGFGNGNTEGRPRTIAEDRQKLKTFDVGTFGRYYFLEIGSRLKPYTELAVGYHLIRQEQWQQSKILSEYRMKGVLAKAGIGANFFLDKGIALNFLYPNFLSYHTFSTVHDGDNSTRSTSSEFKTNFNVFNNFLRSAQFGVILIL